MFKVALLHEFVHLELFTSYDDMRINCESKPTALVVVQLQLQTHIHTHTRTHTHSVIRTHAHNWGPLTK